MRDIKVNKKAISQKESLSSKRMAARKALEGVRRNEERIKREAALFIKKTEELRQKEKKEREKKETEQKKKEKERRIQEDLEKQRNARLQVIKDKAFEKKRSEKMRKARQKEFFRKLKDKHNGPENNDIYDVKLTPNKPKSNPTDRALRIKTYKNDITRTIRSQGHSVVGIANKERAKKEAELNSTPTSTIEKNAKKPYLFIGVMCVILIIILAIGLAYNTGNLRMPGLFKKDSTPTIQISEDELREALISPNTEKNITVNNDGGTDILNEISEEFKRESVPNTIKNIYMTRLITIAPGGREETIEEILNTQDLLDSWVNFMPKSLARSLGNKFMVGVYTNKKKENTPFLVLTTDSKSQAFAGMLDWEKSISGDFYELFGINTVNEVSGSIFRDKVIDGKDARILYKDVGDVVVLYSFANINTIILTTSEEVLTTLLQRLE